MEIKTKIERLQSEIWDSFRAIADHFEAPLSDRYAGEFPYGDRQTGGARLLEAFCYGDKDIRDKLYAAFDQVRHGGDYPWVSVTREDKNKSQRWPYSLHIAVTGPGVSFTLDAYEKMAKYLKAVAKAYPAPYRGRPWEEYKNSYRVDDAMNWKGGAESQIEMFDIIPKLENGIEMHVTGEHCSKSIQLPVVQVELPHNRTRITLRDNFHDICVSVDAKFPVKNTRNFKDLFNTRSVEGSFEGFADEQVHGSYTKNPQKFSAVLYDYPSLMILLGELIRQDSNPPVASAPKPGM